MTYYDADLAWVHHAGYAGYVENAGAGIVRLLLESGLRPGAVVLDVGCGSGLLARRLLTAGFAVHGIDASPAMIELARTQAPAARFDVMALPAGVLPTADAVVSTGHVLNYLDTRADIARALGELAQAVRAGGLLAIDLMTERFAAARDLSAPHAKVEDDWAIITRFARPAPHRFDRTITVFRRVDGTWRRSDEQHRNMTFEPAHALRILRENGIDAQEHAAFGTEKLPEGLIVLAGARR
ncbi:MAG TPA: class I SAM-dependent methyltransferase [Burkholderiaceae bacterium]|nr:class I SAM-dependent methyltransferase [Burkholderiaceae bacterium]